MHFRERGMMAYSVLLVTQATRLVPAKGRCGKRFIERRVYSKGGRRSDDLT